MVTFQEELNANEARLVSGDPSKTEQAVVLFDVNIYSRKELCVVVRDSCSYCTVSVVCVLHSQ